MSDPALEPSCPWDFQSHETKNSLTIRSGQLGFCGWVKAPNRCNWDALRGVTAGAWDSGSVEDLSAPNLIPLHIS